MLALTSWELRCLIILMNCVEIERIKCLINLHLFICSVNGEASCIHGAFFCFLFFGYALFLTEITMSITYFVHYLMKCVC